MEERKVRISYTVNGKKFLSISLEIKEEEALRIFQKFYAYVENEQSSSLDIKKENVEEKTKRNSARKQKQGGKETVYQKILKFVAENGNVTAKDIVEGTGANKRTVSIYLSKMKAAGEITNPKGIKEKYCINNGLNQWPVKEKEASNPKKKEEEKQQEYQEQGVFEKLINNEKYLEIMEYIMNKNSFKVDSIRRSFQQYEELIPDIIRSLTDKKLIYFEDENERYVVPDTTRIWYCLLNEKQPVQDIYISYKLKMQFDKEFVKILQQATKLQLIEEVIKKGEVCYKVKLR